MKVLNTNIDEVKIIELDVFEDERGSFMESWQTEKFNKNIKWKNFVQDNHSISKKGVLRGLHFQNAPYEQGKLVRVVKGSAFDVAVDIRPDSPTYGEYVAVELNETNKRMLWIPEGFAHGFLALEDDTHFLYKTTHLYNKNSEKSFHWNSKDLNIPWPMDHSKLIISPKDDEAPAFIKKNKIALQKKVLPSLINLIEFDILGDERGGLVSLEAFKNVPFQVKRVYYIFNTAEGIARGFHAHKNLKQIAICVSGECKFILDNGVTRQETILNKPNLGLLIEDMTWREMHDFSKDCVLMVLASEYFDESDYIRDYVKFKKLVLKNDDSQAE